MFDARYFSKETTRNRLMKRAADLWGYDDRTPDGFDPLVRLLLEACSVEFEKLGRDIQRTELRLIERLAQALCPGVADRPRPAGALVQAVPNEGQTIVTPETALVFRQPSADRRGETTELFFSPAGEFQLFNATLALLATPAALYQAGSAGQRSLLAEAVRPVRAGERRLWLGLKVAPGIPSLSGFSFYFDWPEEASRDRLCDFLPQVRWYLGKTELPTAGGWLRPEPRQSASSADDDLLEQDVQRLWESHFRTIGGVPDFVGSRQTAEAYPAELESRFGSAALGGLKQPLWWVHLDFPQAFPARALDTMTVTVNTFPVLNRRLNQISYRLQPGLNAVPLPSPEAFIGVRSVENQQQVAYQADSDFRRFRPRTYVVRQQGVGRFDERDGRALLYQLMELLLDERMAFSAVGEEFLASLTNELSQNLSRLEEKLGSQQSVQTTPRPYLMVRTEERGDAVFISYWTTLAEQAAVVPPGSVLQLYSGSALNSGELFLLTRPFGGRPRPNEEEYVAELRKNLLTRNRLVTMEDIRTFCLAELGSRLQSVEIRRMFVAGHTASAGFTRCLKVRLKPAGQEFDRAEWAQLCHALQVRIEDRSAAHLPIQVEVQEL
ncbi:type VI secretion system baseplate subunit TssF [Larkinella soli]|uniref:type VI secretion system baseplate subunit TssF n=1 Tax=Larkinella soli TaxID=1770527 RepID=UPI000FFB57DA|nr:type VI secretion system baseplate subunit TssF [Larkinella soli]